MAENLDVLGPIQQAIYSLLTGDTALMADIEGVHDHVSEGAPFPYVTIGEATETPRNAHDRFGSRSTITLHIWSTYHGWAEAQTIKGHLLRLLDHQPLTLTGHHTVSVRFEQAVTIRDPDPDIRHVPCRFAIETEAA